MLLSLHSHHRVIKLTTSGILAVHPCPLDSATMNGLSAPIIHTVVAKRSSWSSDEKKFSLQFSNVQEVVEVPELVLCNISLNGILRAHFASNICVWNLQKG